MKAIARALGVSRSNVLEQLRERAVPAPPPEPSPVPESAENEAILSDVRAIVNVRASYGYRRVTALLNRARARAREPRVNPKRIYRLMKQEKLLLERCTGDRPGRTHDGVIVTLKPNLRWCSDAFEIRCWNGERVHVAFALDCCDRELVGFIARSEPLCGEHIRDMMVQAVESRFGAGTRKLPATIEWLSDNGSIYTSTRARSSRHS